MQIAVPASRTFRYLVKSGTCCVTALPRGIFIFVGDHALSAGLDRLEACRKLRQELNTPSPMENSSYGQETMASAGIQINVERLMGGAGGSGGPGTHGGTGGTGGHGLGARIIDSAQNVIIHNHSDTNKILDTALEKQLEGWLNAPDPKEKHSRLCGLENRSPCSWLFEDDSFILWKNNPGELLWIQGASGTGKTIISSMIIEHLFEARVLLTNSESIAIAYFYFDFADSAMQSVEHALRRLVLQLSHQNPAPYVTLDQEYKLCDGQTVPTYFKLLEILEKLLRLRRTYLILDALDECKAADHNRVVDFIQKISRWSDIQLHVLVTSQPHNIFEKAFMSLQNLSRITIHADKTLDDIRVYISNELASKSELQFWKPEWGHIATYITQKSAGMFRLAYCLLEQLKECARLDDLQTTLDTLPDNLHDIYSRSLKSIPKIHLLDVQRLLHWLVFSKQPLTLEELEDTISFDFSDPEQYTFDTRKRPKRGIFIKWLSILVSIDSWQENVLDLNGFYYADCTVSLAHSSVQDYLLLEQENHPNLCFSCPVHITEEAAHQLMAKTCVCYLLHFADNLLNEETFPNYPLAMYAAKNWTYHLLCCHDRTGLSNLTMDLLKSGSNQYAALTRLHRGGKYPCWSSFIDPPLYLCAALGYIEGVEFLLDGGADVNAVGQRFIEFGGPHETALHAASMQGYLAIVHLLLEKGADFNAEDRGVTALQLAIRHGHIEIVHLLLEKGANINVNMPSSYGTPLQLASEKGYTDMIHLLIEKGADINAKGRRGSALQIASAKGHLEIVTLLLKNNADINMRGWNGTALQLGSKWGHIEVVRLLLDKGADINAAGEDGTAVQIALKCGHIEIVEILLKKGANVNVDGMQGSALHFASAKGYTETVRLLLRRGANINAMNEGNCSALKLALLQGHNTTFQLLLENGADTTTNNGGTVLQLASKHGRTEIVHLLLEKGADINAMDEENCSALQLASLHGRLKTVCLLLDNGADHNAKSKTGTALQLASYYGHIKIVRCLLKKGANVNAKGEYGTALQLASRNGHIGIIRLLLMEGAHVNAQSGWYGTALQLASEEGYIEIVHLLLAKGAHVNAHSIWNETALQLASRTGHIEIVRLLLENNADVNAQGGWYGTAWRYASKRGHTEIVKLLLEHGATPCIT
ncbi:Ankyrin repeat protein [Mycena venus]|uniref:Ankyrin repeat protein n=1 Tax=Mycena venus TaxID=2733690 RepID=A0A8H7DAJ8_9AGAR|nr:Ankyrin repeat protein [Mycena venus]